MTDIMQINIALRKLELFDTHGVHAMRSLGQAVMEEVSPPRLVTVEIEYPPHSDARYVALVTKPHAVWLRELFVRSKSSGQVLDAIHKRLACVKKKVNGDVIPDLVNLLNNTPDEEPDPGGQVDDVQIHTALREFELADTHLFQVMRSLELALFGYQRPPEIVSVDVEYPPSSTDPYNVALTEPHAAWVRDLLSSPLSPNGVLQALADQLSAVGKGVVQDVLPDYYELLANAKLDGADAETGPLRSGGGDPPPIGCCQLPNGTQKGNLTQSQCLAYGTGSIWTNTGNGCKPDTHG
jgi:hypothetical protein